MSLQAGAISPYRQCFKPDPTRAESAALKQIIQSLNLGPHIEGGYFAETDRAFDLVFTPFSKKPSNTLALAPQRPGFNPDVRNSSTTIFYLLTPSGPQGSFHRNAGRTVHTLHKGRGRYVIIHADEQGKKKKRIETFVVGHDLSKGERLQWIVEGGKYKASFLLPDKNNETGEMESDGLLISETVVPGFEFCDHDFLTKEGLEKLVTRQQVADLDWLLREG